MSKSVVLATASALIGSAPGLVSAMPMAATRLLAAAPSDVDRVQYYRYGPYGYHGYRPYGYDGYYGPYPYYGTYRPFGFGYYSYYQTYGCYSADRYCTYGWQW
jgi:hypothetical protein